MSELVVRPMRPADADAVRAGFASLSAESLRRRFFSPVPRLTSSMLADLVAVDPASRIVLLAFDGTTRRLLGGVRAVRWRTDPTTADVAVTVGDAHQGRGIGTALLRAISREAPVHGIARLGGHVLVDNAPARAMLARAGARLDFDEPGVLRFELPLAVAVPTAA